MVRRVLKIKSYVDVAIRNLYHDKVEFKKMRPGPTLSATDEVALEKLLEVLADIETATQDLSAEKTPTLHMIYLETAGLVERLNSFINSTRPGTDGHELSKILSSSLKCRRLKKSAIIGFHHCLFRRGNVDSLVQGIAVYG